MQGLIFAITLASAVVAGTILAVAVAGVAKNATSRESTAMLTSLGREVAERIARSVDLRRRELEGLVRIAQASTGPDELRLRFDTIIRLDDRYGAIGFSRPDGRVVAATGYLQEGAGVSDRPWFRAGLQGPYLGEVREAAHLRAVRVEETAEPLRLFDLAAPVRRADGTLAGVVSSHVSWADVRDVVRGALQGSGRDALLVSRSGVVLAGPPEFEGRKLDLSSMIAARQGAASSGLVERWPDGEDYLTAVVAPIVSGTLPSFGWSLMVRQEAGSAAGPARAITRPLALGLLAASVVLFVGSFLSGWLVARPLRRLSASMTDLACGHMHEVVPGLAGYREVQGLSEVLEHLRDRMSRGPGAALIAPPAPRDKAASWNPPPRPLMAWDPDVEAGVRDRAASEGVAAECSAAGC